MSAENIEIRSVVLCEEVRREVNQRATLIGVMSFGTPVRNGPTKLDRLALYVDALVRNAECVEYRLWNEEKSVAVVSSSINLPSKLEFEKENPSVEYSNVQFSAVLVSNNASVEMPGPGDYLFQVRQKGLKDWTTKAEFHFPQLEENSE
jgi:hypothetical protein